MASGIIITILIVAGKYYLFIDVLCLKKNPVLYNIITIQTLAKP